MFCRHRTSFKWKMSTVLWCPKNPPASRMCWEVRSPSTGRFAGTYMPSAHLSPRTEHAVCCPAAQRGSSDLGFRGALLSTPSSPLCMNLYIYTYIDVYICTYKLNLSLYMIKWGNQGQHVCLCKICEAVTRGPDD